MKENKKFNRIESDLEHDYYNEFGGNDIGKHLYEGFIKCKLLHGPGYSLVVPDQIYIFDSQLLWFQPLSFLPNICLKTDLDTICTLYIDISCRQTLEVTFHGKNLIELLQDGSNYFKCQIKGPELLSEYATGTAELINGIPFLRLYHHTSVDSKIAIQKSGVFHTSPWNFQGTTKKLKNISYAYFTCLDRIDKDQDLVQIAMSAIKEIHLMRDNFVQPSIMLPDWKSKYKNDILVLDVYPSSPDKRCAVLEMKIDSTILAPQYLLRHEFTGQQVYYQVCNPFIYRIGAEPGAHIAFDSQRYIVRQSKCKMFDYVVVGDATNLTGLAAPYNEEDTTNIMKMEKIPMGSNLIDFWFTHANSDLFTQKQVTMQEFEN